MNRKRSPLRQIVNHANQPIASQDTSKKPRHRISQSETKIYITQAIQLNQVLTKIQSKKQTICFKDFFWHISSHYLKKQALIQNFIRQHELKKLAKIFAKLKPEPRKIKGQKRQRPIVMNFERMARIFRLKTLFRKWKASSRHRFLPTKLQLPDFQAKLKMFLHEMKKSTDSTSNNHVQEKYHLDQILQDYGSVTDRNHGQKTQINVTRSPQIKKTNGISTRNQKSVTKTSSKPEVLQKTKSLQKIKTVNTERKSLPFGSIDRLALMKKQINGEMLLQRLEQLYLRKIAQNFQMIKIQIENEQNQTNFYENQVLSKVFYEWCTTVRNHNTQVKQQLKAVMLRRAFNKMKQNQSRSACVSFGRTANQSFIYKIQAWLDQDQSKDTQIL